MDLFSSGLEVALFSQIILTANAELSDDLVILANVRAFEIIQEFPSPRDHLQQSATRIVVLFVDLEMFRQLVDALRKQCDLYMRRTRVRIVTLVIRNYLFFNFFNCRHLSCL